MAKTARATHVIFGSLGSSDNFAEFGSLVDGSPVKTKDMATIQALPAWTSGFQAAVYTSNKALLLEDLNSWALEHSTMIGYLFQEGIPEWDAGTTYWIGSYVKKTGTKQLYCSLVDTNLANALPAAVSNANWEYVNPPAVQDTGLVLNDIPRVSVAAVTGASPAQLAASHLTQDANYVITAKPIKFADATSQSTAASPITSQSDVTAARALSVTYQNTTGKVMFVSVIINGGMNSAGAQAFTDATAAPTVHVSSYAYAGIDAIIQGGAGAMFFIVLPGNYYKVVPSGSASMTAWIEWT